MRRKFFIFIITVVISAFLILAGCTTENGTSSTTPSYKTLSIDQIPEEAQTILLASDPDGAGSLLSLARIIMVTADVYLQLALMNWDETFPSEYSEGGITINWSHSGNTWVWEWSDGIDTFKLTVTKIDTGWTLQILLNGETIITGSVNDNGSEGTITLYDDESDDYYVVTWEPASSPYTITVTMELYESDILIESLTLSTNADGSIGEWVYDDLFGANDDNGSWPE